MKEVFPDVQKASRAAAESAVSHLHQHALKQNGETKEISTLACYVKIITVLKRCHEHSHEAVGTNCCLPETEPLSLRG
jgi:hypothetical protein